MIEGIRLTREVIAQNAFDPYCGKELAPSPTMLDEHELTEWLRAMAMAVVDGRLKVHSIKGLRIADASVMPIISSGNTNAPSIIIGEECAEFILNT